MLASSSKSTLRRKTDIISYRDETSGILRETLSPDDKGKLQLVHVTLDAGKRISYPEGAYQFIAFEQIHVLAGSLTFLDGDTSYSLKSGDTVEVSCRNPCTFAASAESNVSYLVLSTNI